MRSTLASARVTTEVSEELKALREENAELRRANEIPRTAPAAELGDAYAANVVLDCWTANRGVDGARKLWHVLRREATSRAVTRTPG